MVVASSGWVKNTNNNNNNPSLNKNDNNNMNTSVNENNNKMNAKGVLICRDNSHAFQDRTLNLDEPIKIGRSVARTRAAIDNAIFDCKVLSRNHALLWYNAGKFYLQDTGSSNGTFVNNQRLSSTGSESKAKEVCSGDIVQFGVDVIESTKKVTHGCIIATLKLYLPDGKEAKASRTMYVTKLADVTLEDLYKLNQYVQEANRREKVLQSKLTCLQKLVDNMRISASESWKALIDEDRLLSRVKTVESQLVAYSKNFTEDKIRNELVKLEEEKSQYQIVAKETLQKVHIEKIELTQKLMQLESRLNETEDECQSLHDISKNTQLELQELAVKYTTSQKNSIQLEEKLIEKEQITTEIIQSAEQERQDLIDKLINRNKIEHYLKRKLKQYRLDSLNIHKEITSFKNYLQTIQDTNVKLITDDDNNEQSKEEEIVNPIDTINKILDSLNGIIAESDNIDDLDNFFASMENIHNSHDIDSNQKTSTEHLNSSYEKNEIDAERQILAEYILPPTSRRTLINGKASLDINEKQDDIDVNSETSDDTCSINTEDTCSLVGDDSSEKSVIEMKLVDEKINRDLNKLEVRFASDANGKQLEIHYDADDRNEDEEEEEEEEEETGQGDDSSDSADSPNASLSSITATDCKDEKDDDIEKSEDLELDDEKKKEKEEDEEEVEEEEDGEHLEGDYIKTLKPLPINYRSSNITREHILQNFIIALESIKGDDNIESQQIVNRELDDIRNWFIQESNEQTIEKLKELYYRTKNENSRMQEVNEELVILKEKFELINSEKIEITKQLKTLKNQRGDMINLNYSIPIQYFAPIVIAFGWMLFEKIF